MKDVGIRALNDTILRVDLKKPAPYFLELTSHPIYSPIHRLIDQRYPQWPYQSDKSYPCNGAFLLKTNEPEQVYTLEKNSHYWDAGHIHLDQVIFNRMTPYQALQAFRRGEIDWLGHPLGSWQTFYVPEQDDRIVSFPDSSVCWCVLNNSTHPFSHKKLRQALAFVLQRCEFLTNSPLSLNPAYTPLLPQHSQQVFDEFPQHDVRLARRLWHEGWAELGIQKNRIPSMSLIFHHKGIRQHVAEHLQHQLKKYLDFQCDLKPLPWNILFEKMTKGDFEMGLMQWVSWVNDSIYTLNAFRLPDEDINFSKWSNPVFQELLDRSDLEINRKKRSSLLAEAEKILCEEVPVIPLFYQPYQALVKKNLQIAYNCSRATFNLARSFKKKDVPDVNRTY